MLSLLLCVACVDDPGNYNYKDPETILPIEISGLSDTTFKILETISLKPEIKGLGDEENYEFTWYSYPVGNIGYSLRDTLGRERNLTFKMEYAVGETRALVFEVKEKKTGVFVNKKITFRGIAEFSSGYLVLNEENNTTDVDFIYPDERVRENLLAEKGISPLSGTAVKIAYQDGSYTHQTENEDGTLSLEEGLSVWHLLSSEDMITLDASDLTLYKRGNEQFYTAPDVVAPSNLYYCNDLGVGPYLMNNGAIHSSGSSGSIGKFGAAKLGSENLFSEWVECWYDIYAYDMSANTFVATVMNSINLQPYLSLSDLPETKDKQLEMLHLLQRGIPASSAINAYALMREGTISYLADITFKASESSLNKFIELSNDSQLAQADVYAAHAENYIWFAKGNQLQYCQVNDADMFESSGSLYPFPQGETITWMQQIMPLFSSLGNEGYYNYLLVLTNGTEGWKLYRFELSDPSKLTPQLDPNPKIFSGKGFARYALWLGDE